MKKILATIIAVCAFSHSAYALDAKVEKNSTASAASVWAAVGDFCGIAKWHPAVAKCVLSEKDGKTFRELTLGDGGKIFEEQVSFDAAKMTYTYKILESVLPVSNYQSTLSVVANGDGSTVSWGGTFDAKEGSTDEDAVKTMTGVYTAGVEALAKTK